MILILYSFYNDFEIISSCLRFVLRNISLHDALMHMNFTYPMKGMSPTSFQDFLFTFLSSVLPPLI